MLQDNIKIIRKNKGYSQEELASKLHVTRQTISKWETGQSVPDANLLKQLSVIFDVSVSELMDGNAERILENEVIVEQLSRVNENLVLAHKRFSRIAVVAVCVCVFVALFFGFSYFRVKKSRGELVQDIQHIGELTYSMPSTDKFYHKENDIGIRVLKDGSQQIAAKIYRCYDDMTEISIWNYGDYTQEIIDEFEEMYANHILDFTEICGTFPSGVEFFVQASYAWFEGDNIYSLGSFYKAYIKLDGKLYYVSVTGGDQPLIYGEQVVSTLAINKTLQEELIEKESYIKKSGV